MTDANRFTEKRIHPRVPLNIPVKHRVLDEQREMKTIFDRKSGERVSHTVNVSLGGLCLAGNSGMSVGSIVRLEINLPETSNILSAFGEVVWAMENGEGLHFEAIKEEDADLLKNYLIRWSAKIR